MNHLFLEASLTLGEKFALSGEILLRGMGTVFMVLILLWGIVAAFGKVFAGTGKKSAEKKPETQSVQAAEPIATPEPAAASDDGALVAAITTAIEAYRSETGGANTGFRVVSFRQKKSSGGWMGNDNQ